MPSPHTPGSPVVESVELESLVSVLDVEFVEAVELESLASATQMPSMHTSPASHAPPPVQGQPSAPISHASSLLIPLLPTSVPAAVSVAVPLSPTSSVPGASSPLHDASKRETLIVAKPSQVRCMARLCTSARREGAHVHRVL
jgi:hypothetical protein